MALANIWVYKKTIIEWEKLSTATHNCYKVVSVKLHKDKKGKLPNGLKLHLTVLYDDYDYGKDKDGNQRDSNVDQNFDAIILRTDKDIKKGDYVTLLEFDEENSFPLDYDFVMYFHDVEVVNPELYS